MKIFACFEGITDTCAIEILMNKCAGGKRVVLNIESYTHASLKEIKYNKSLSKTNKTLRQDAEKFTRIMAIKKLLFLADKENSSHIAYHQDAGHDGFKTIYNATKKAFADAGVPSDVKTLAIVPKEMTESWLLSDISAINRLKSANTQPVSQSPNPETLWGNKNDPASDYPKNYLARILDGFGLESNQETYASIAKHSDIEILKKRCPISFTQFYTDMQSFIGNGEDPAP